MHYNPDDLGRIVDVFVSHRRLVTQSHRLLRDVVRVINPAEACWRTEGLAGTCRRAEAAAIAGRPVAWLEDDPLA